MLTKSVSILGSGNWGSTVGKIIAENVTKYASVFNQRVNMYVYEEQVEGRDLSQIINTQHENVKYLPQIKLPPNLVAEPDILKCVQGADVLFLVLPFQFVGPTLTRVKDSVKAGAYAVTLAKGVYYDAENKDLLLLSQLTRKIWNVPCYSMMGANIANEVASDHLCETTVGCDDEGHARELSQILSNSNFLVQNSKDVAPVEMLGALKNIYAFGYGVLSQVPNVTHCTLVVLLRMAMIEMLTFIKNYCAKQNIPVHDLSQLTLHSCAYPDLLASSMGGRNARMGRMFSEDFFTKGKSLTIPEYEKEHLNGQKIQGTLTADEINKFLVEHDLVSRYPLMMKIHQISHQQAEPQELLEALRQFKYSPQDV